VKLLTTDIRYQDKIAKLDGTGASPFAWAQIPNPVLTSSSSFAAVYCASRRFRAFGLESVGKVQ
jgi:hypothetical protein